MKNSLLIFALCLIISLESTTGQEHLRADFLRRCNGNYRCLGEAFECYGVISGMFGDINEVQRSVRYCLNTNNLIKSFENQHGDYLSFLSYLDSAEPAAARVQRCCALEEEGMLTSGNLFSTQTIKLRARNRERGGRIRGLGGLTAAIDTCAAPRDCMVEGYMECLLDGCIASL